MTVLVGTWLRSTFELIGLRVGATVKFSIGRFGTHISLQAPATRFSSRGSGKAWWAVAVCKQVCGCMNPKELTRVVLLLAITYSLYST